MGSNEHDENDYEKGHYKYSNQDPIDGPSPVDDEKALTTKDKILGFITLVIFIISWNIAYDIIGYPHGFEYVKCFFLALVITIGAIMVINFFMSMFKD